MAALDRHRAYLEALKRPFQKVCRLRFLNWDGSTAFSVDNDPKNPHSKAFIAEGSLSVNLQNGVRRTASVTLDGVDQVFAYQVNSLWFGQEIALDEGLVLPDGEPYYLQQGVFLLQEPTESVEPAKRIITYKLVDKWANLDGTLWGYLDGTYRGSLGANIFQQINALLRTEKGNGRLVDPVAPVYTEYYNGKTQELADGTTANLVDAPYTLTVNPESGTYAAVILGFTEMLNAWVGYDAAGRLRIDASQDDISDESKPVCYEFSMGQTELCSLSYTDKPAEVYNDYIVVGDTLENGTQPVGRSSVIDPESDVNVNLIGIKTKFEMKSEFATVTQCGDLAVWNVKRSAALKKNVAVTCSQIFHIQENELVTIVRTDKPGNPIERHLVMGFSRPLASNGAMTISAVSVNDLPNSAGYTAAVTLIAPAGSRLSCGTQEYQLASGATEHTFLTPLGNTTVGYDTNAGVAGSSVMMISRCAHYTHSFV
uniref:Tail protein n=1 Tax=Siphoviridae sp. ctBeL15 TaxID=2825374 RepID=A0A8S5V071_9CAUD|nr:MAG TPA: tail protein [Siphoviridae sp. ctBeL15]